MSKRITARKRQAVYVPDNRWAGGFSLKNRSVAGEYLTNDWGNTWVRQVKRYVYLDGYSIDEAVKTLRKEAEGLSDAMLSIDRNEDGYPEVNVFGYRPATEEEITDVVRYLTWERERMAERGRVQKELLIQQAKAAGLTPEDLA